MTAQDSSDWLGLSGRVCVVTGGGGGVGRAVAASLARAGARVAAIDRDERGLEATRTELRELGCEHVITRCDTASAESVAAASETTLKSLGPCSVLVNAAAVVASRWARKSVACRVERRSFRQPDRLFPLRPDLWPAAAKPRPRPSHSSAPTRPHPSPP